MLRTRLYRYKLSEFSYLTGIDTYRLKKLDQQGILPARLINGRRYYDETAAILAAYYSDGEFAKPSIHNIVIAIGKLLTLVKTYNKMYYKQDENMCKANLEFVCEDCLRDVLNEQDLDNIDIGALFKCLIEYMEQVRSVINTKDDKHKVEDEPMPVFKQKIE